MGFASLTSLGRVSHFLLCFSHCFGLSPLAFMPFTRSLSLFLLLPLWQSEPVLVSFMPFSRARHRFLSLADVTPRGERQWSHCSLGITILHHLQHTFRTRRGSLARAERGRGRSASIIWLYCLFAGGLYYYLSAWSFSLLIVSMGTTKLNCGRNRGI